MQNVNISHEKKFFEKLLFPFPQGYLVGRFLCRYKRFSIAVELNGKEVWAHSNNSGSMLGLLRKGTPVLLSKSDNIKRKLAYTQEAVWLPRFWQDNAFCGQKFMSPKAYLDGFWVGVNTSIPNKILELAFYANRLSFTKGYTNIKREAKRGNSRLDALFTAENMPNLWVECKNVTMVEDNIAMFPDAVSTRGQKHLYELMDIVKAGERAAMFYLVQRTDGACFAPADCIDEAYTKLFWQAVDMGVEVYPIRAIVGANGIELGETLPLSYIMRNL